MSVTAGALSQTYVDSSSAKITSAPATAGTGPYIYQLHKSTTNGFSPGGGTLIPGATSLVNTVSGLNPNNTTYYFVMVVTDTGASNATANSAQLTVVTTASQQSQNQFSQRPVVGMLDLAYNYNTRSAQIDLTQATALYAGQPVKRASGQTGVSVPKLISITADTDLIFGFINYDIKTVAFLAGSMCEVSGAGNVMFLPTAAAISAGAQVCWDSLNGGVVAATGSSAKTIIGYATDGAAASGATIRVTLQLPGYTLDS